MGKNNVKIGEKIKISFTLLKGIIRSLVKSLMASEIGWSRPKTLTLFGPTRF